jgi:hypothetical protein
MAIVPEGPLHPTIAVGSLAAGAAVTLVACWHGRRRGPGNDAVHALLVAAAGSMIVAASAGHAPWQLLPDAGDRVLRSTWLAAAGTGALGALTARVSPRVALVLCLVVLAVAWATVPDTEAPLALGCGLLVPSLLAVRPMQRPSRAHTASLAALSAMAGGAAAIGARGRPERAWCSVAAACAVAGAAGLFAAVRRARRRRAAIIG